MNPVAPPRRIGLPQPKLPPFRDPLLKPHLPFPRSAISASRNEPQQEAIRSGDVTALAKFQSRHNHIRVLEVSRRADHQFAGSFFSG